MFGKFWKRFAGRKGLATIVLAMLLLPVFLPASAYAASVRVTGNGNDITNGATVSDTSTANGTDFGSAVFQSLGFGEQVTHIFTVHNDGGADFDVTGFGTQVTGGTGLLGEFTISPQTSFTVPAGGSSDFTIVFSPRASGLRNAQITMNTDIPLQFRFGISGEGTVATTAQIEVSGNDSAGGSEQPISHGDTTPDVNDGTDFGLVNIDSGTSSRTFTISNPGTVDLLLGAASISGTHAADFRIAAQPASTVMPGGSTTVTVEFDPDYPQAPGAVPDRNATLNIAYDGNSSFSFAIVGHAGDLDAPTVAISGVPTIANGPFTATFTFSEGVTGFDIADITVGNGTASNFAAVSASVYTALIAPAAAGVVTIDVAAGAAQDFSSNDNLAAAQASTTYDDSAPSVFILGAPASIANLNPFPVTIRFSEPVTGFAASGVLVGNGTVSGFSGSGDTYQLTVSPSSLSAVTLDVPAGVAQDADLNGNVAAAQVVVDVNLVGVTKARITEFLVNRGNHILQNQPDLISFLNGSHASGGGSLGSLKSNFTEEGGALSFATSLNRILAGRGEQAAVATNDGAGFDEGQGAAPSRRFDVWAELHGAASNSGDADSSFWVGYLGAHYFLSPDLLLGGLVQGDWQDEDNDATGSNVSGFGWMVGPYVAGRVPDHNLFFEARAAWGRSDNDINPFGTYSDAFETSRWLARAKLSGLFEVDSWRLIPEASFAWYQETQESYVDSLDNFIDEQTASIGEVRFGPKVGYGFALDDGGSISPTLGVSGVWNFGIRENAASTGVPLGNGDLRARIDAGFDFRLANGVLLTSEGYYDGVGAEDYEAYGGKLRLTVPLN